MAKLNLQNWNYAHFNSEHFIAMISIVAAESDGEVTMKYSPTVIDEDKNEIFQCDFDNLEEAISFTNKKYGHWSFRDPSENSSESGCSSCKAH